MRRAAQLRQQVQCRGDIPAVACRENNGGGPQASPLLLCVERTASIERTTHNGVRATCGPRRFRDIDTFYRRYFRTKRKEIDSELVTHVAVRHES